MVAGANDYKPGISLGPKNHMNGVQVTLTGTAYCKVTNSNGAISAGDLPTTSDVAGHAMRATDADRSRGAVLGKAMQNFDGESGLIMILASLQ